MQSGRIVRRISKTMKHDYWEIVQAMPAAEMADLMRRFEHLGLYGVWSPQLQSTPFATLAAAAMVTKRLKLGSGIGSHSRAVRWRQR